jgi:hypothetical protein
MTTPASGETPRVETKTAVVGAAAVGVDTQTIVAEAPYAGTVSRVGYIPVATITGAATNSRTLTATNRGQAGAGSTNVATLALVSGVNAPADAEKPVTLNATPANLVVAAGDVISFESVHVGTGIADPGGEALVEFTRS